jgi:hypothetical protein
MQVFFPAGNGCFEARELGDELVIDEGGAPFGPGAGDPDREAARIVRWRDGDGRPGGAALLADPSRVVLNGRRLWPLVVLRRGDEIRVGSAGLFFTDESPLRVVAYEPGAGPAETCLRCHAPLRAGEPIVRCPGCGSPYMAQADRDPNCWTFGPCLACGREPRAEFSWRPGPEPQPGPAGPAEGGPEVAA